MIQIFFFVLLNIFVIQTVCFNVNNATVFIFPMLYRVFSQAISLSLENGYIYFSGGGEVYEGGKAAIQHRSPCLQKIFLCYARPMNKRISYKHFKVLLSNAFATDLTQVSLTTNLFFSNTFNKHNMKADSISSIQFTNNSLF